MATATTGVDPSIASAYTPSTAPVNPKGQLKSDDFIKLLITQLQNQDPTQPMKNEELLQQVSQIGSLQSQQQLTSSLQDMVMQNQLAAASGMIGKSVQGLDDYGDTIGGVVTSVKVVDKKVTLELDSGKNLQMSRVQTVSPAPGASSATQVTASSASLVGPPVGTGIAG
jgi:flagellar basal-body rod modification protein FlgD